MSLLVFQNGVYTYKSIPDKQSSYIIKNDSQSLEFEEYVPYSNCLCKLDVSDPVKYINSDCITLSFDSNSMTVYPWMESFYVTVKDMDSITISENEYATLTLAQI